MPFMSIYTNYTAQEGLKQFEELKVRFENEYHMKEEMVSVYWNINMTTAINYLGWIGDESVGFQLQGWSVFVS